MLIKSVGLSRLLGLPLAVLPALAQPYLASVTTANYGSARTNANTAESTLTRAAVSSGSFGKIASIPVDGQIYAQPLFVSGVQFPDQSVADVVFVATMNNTVYAIDAAAFTVLWQTNLGPAVPSSAVPYLTDINPQVGILSTPVIDPDAQILYAVAETWESSGPVFRLHALALSTGQETANGPVVISATVPGTGAASVNGAIAFDPLWHLQRPGLALANGNIYICFASHGDAGNFHGWVMAYSAANVQQQVAVFNTTPNGNEGGIWQSGHAPAIDSSGNLYVISGNGDFDGLSNFSGAVLKLSGSDLSLLDWFTPAQWQYLDANDLDVGSTSAILASSGLLLAGDKGGRLLTLSTASLGHIEAAPGANDFLASAAGIFDLALWQTDQGATLFEHDWNGYLKAYSVTADQIVQTPISTGTWRGDSLYQGLVVSSNGSSDGILWETTGDHSTPGIPATLHAWNASDLTQELWNSNLQPGDVLGSFAKFVSPLVANGQVYVPTFSNELTVYGIKPAAQTPALTPQVSSILNGASFVATAVSPGEILAILGTNLGPASQLNAQVTAADMPLTLGGVQVFFDGTPAPLLYVSSTQIGVVVPYEVSGTTQMVVQSSAGLSAVFSLPVAAATPALFTTTGLGGGQASALNQDGTPNSASNPAAAGSIISLYVTGLGQTTPPGIDGAIAGPTPALPNLPISVTIGSLPAQILYAGSVPGLIDGAFQINVLIPANAPDWSTVPIVLQAGSAFSQSNTWIAIQ